MRTRQGARTEPPFIERRSSGRKAQDWQDEDPLDEIVSHTPARASGFLRGRTTRVGEEWGPN